MKALKLWYNALSPRQKALVSFSAMWFLMFPLWLLSEWFIGEGERSWRQHIRSAVIQATFMALLFNWNNFKIIFKKNKDEAAM